jgi:hypothetical protein
MRIIPIALLLAATAAHALEPRWQQMPNASISAVYIDTLSAGDGPWEQRKVWILRDHPTPKDGVIWSDRVLYVFNCARSAFAVKDVINYTQPLGQGYPQSSVLHSAAQLQFTDVAPGTISEGLFVIACAKH